MRRKFNQNAYNKYDHVTKEKIANIFKKKGYEILGDINEEHYKEYDIKLVNNEGKTISFENEVRVNYETIMSRFTTFHIPIRKINTKADIYVIWNRNLNRISVLKNKQIKEYKNNIKEVDCQSQEGDYCEEFIDIPKNIFKHYRVGDNYDLFKID